ncbi:MAG TPA: DUF2520 domain-containing protein [Gemmatimonadaceae bacterium]
MSLEQPRVAIIGAGRLGTALAAALRQAKIHVDGPFGRDIDPTAADVVLLCVPDAAVGGVALRLPKGAIVGHCSGALTLDALAPHEALSMHPLMTVTARGAEFRGAACAIAASSERARGVAMALARALGMHPIAVADADRALYHAAASLASNYLVALEGAAERLASRVGVDRADLAPLVRAALENWLTQGAAGALTGPVVRGDVETVARQRAAVAGAEPDLLPAWDALTELTERLALTRTA